MLKGTHTIIASAGLRENFLGDWADDIFKRKTINMISDLIDKTSYNIQYGNVLGILMIHGVGYYIVHRSMHVVSFLRKYHNFHHEFDEYIMPSIGNAVTTEEFLTAYIAPFIFSSWLLQPNETSFVIPIALISVFNNIIPVSYTHLTLPTIYSV